MKTRKPLVPSDVPPGSFLRCNKWQANDYVSCWIFESCIQTPNADYEFETLANDSFEILRPGETWQPCYKEVEEFSPADYKPGQEVDVETARKLHAAGVGLECNYDLDPKWESMRGLFNATDSQINKHWQIRVAMPPGELTADEARAAYNHGAKVQFKASGCEWRDCFAVMAFNEAYKYRLKPAPKIRPITKAELPPRFIWQQKDGCAWVINSASIDAEWINGRVKIGDTWGHDVRGPWNDFTVTEEPK